MLYLHRANNLEQLRRAAELKVGVEIDIRTHRGIPHLAHDAMVGWENDLSLEEAMKFLLKRNVPVILDFKESGIIDSVLEVIGLEGAGLCIAADLIVPDQLYAERKGLRTLSRWSMFEEIHLEAAYGRWMDFISSTDDIRLLQGRKPLPENTFLVSPELHHHTLTDAFIRVAKRRKFTGVCTDFPERWRIV